MSTSRWVWANAGFLALLLVCADPGRGMDPSVVSPPMPDPATAPNSEPAAPDDEVLRVVFNDLLTYAGKDSPVAVRGSLPKEILVAAMRPDRSPTFEELLLYQKDDFWGRLSQAQCAAVREAADELARRTRAHDFLLKSLPSDPRVRVQEGDPLAPTVASYGRTRQRPTTVYPPGFSHDRRVAFVRLSIPWSIHYADGTYVLSERDGVWEVCLRQFVFFP